MSLRHGFSAFRQAAAMLRSLVRALARDSAGNTMMIVAFSLIPILAMIGGGIDMGRGYLSQSRLQQACDAGVLAARKKIGNTIPTTNIPTSAVQTVGDQFFDLNFQSGAYGTASRTFSMNIESDTSVTGTATVSVPTTLMRLFGYTALPISVTCQAKINFSNTDVMMVLDTTGSMNETNPGDTKPKIDVLRDTVNSFYAQLEAQKGAGTRIRYGFVPYSTNVNVGFLLKSDWLVDSWNYHSREPHDTGSTVTWNDYSDTDVKNSGSNNPGTTYVSTTCPPDTISNWNPISSGTDANGKQYWVYEYDGTSYSCSGIYTTTYVSENNYAYTLTGYNVTPTVWHHYNFTRTRTVTTNTAENWDWHYASLPLNVSGLKTSTDGNLPPTGGYVNIMMGGYPEGAYNYQAWWNGCIEERDTYEITDYANIDLTRAKDLDLDLVPVTSDNTTRWRPLIQDASFDHSLTWSNYTTWPWTPSGDYLDGDFINAQWNGYAACPAAASKLQVMTASQISTYVNSLVAQGSTYHDIGMIWGGRLLSPTGIFAAENADLSSGPTRRHLIFLTDGLTAPNVLSYGAYGIEPLDKRRWSDSSTLTLTQTVEKRFTAACDEVKKKNITVWVIGFGQTLNPVLSNCAGTGHAFYANDASSLNGIFNSIAGSMGDLRVSR